MRLDRARTVLWSAIEDYAPLWEVAWELHPDAPRIGEAERDSTRKLIKELLQRGLISLYWLVEPDGEPVQVPGREEAEGLLHDDGSWEMAPWGDRSVRISATEAGEKAYAELVKTKEARPSDKGADPEESASNGTSTR